MFELNSCGVELKADLRVSLMKVTRNLDSTQISKLLSIARDFDDSSVSQSGSEDTRLSKRELDVLLLLANGYTRRDIGNTLDISLNTAARHISNIYSKLQISSVAEATQYAYANSII